MRKSAENEGNTHRIKEYFSPRIKVKDLPDQQHRLISFFQETPMKPLSHQLPRKILPLHSPDSFNGESRCPPPHSPQPPGPVCSLRPVSSNLGKLSSPVKRPQPMQSNRHGHPEHSLKSPGPVCSLGFVPSIPTPAKRSSKSQSANHCSLKNLNKHLSACQRDEVKKPIVSLSSTGSKNVTTQRQESSKDHASQQHKGTPSTEMFLPEGLSCSSQKRQRVAEYDKDEDAKKVCLQSTSRGQTAKCTVGRSACTSQASSRHSAAKSTDAHVNIEPTSGQSASMLSPSQSSCVSPKPYVPRLLQTGVKQACIDSILSAVVRLKDIKLSSVPPEEDLSKGNEEKNPRFNAITSSGVLHKNNGSSHNVPLNRHYTGHAQQSTSVLPDKIPSRTDQVGESGTPKPASKPKVESLSSRVVERNKASRPRRPPVIPDDIGDLFTPDPLTYLVHSAYKSAKPKLDGGEIKSPTSQKCSSSSTVTSSSSPSTVAPIQNSTATPLHEVEVDSRNVETSAFSSAMQPKVSLPAVKLERIKIENFVLHPMKATGLKNSPVPSSDRQLNHEGIRTAEEPESCFLPKNVRSRTLETDAPTSARTSTSRDAPSTPEHGQKGEEGGEQLSEVDALDVELDLGLSLELDLDLSQSSQSSDEEEELMSLQDMMKRISKPADTPEKGTYSDLSTPVKPGCHSKPQILPSTKLGIYKNNLDQMLKEINSNKRSKEIETKLLTACKEDLLRVAEYEDEENQQEAISSEHQEFLLRYSLTSHAIREVPPGELVFNLENFGRIFNQHSLQLRECTVNPQDAAQKTLLWSSPAQLRLHITVGLFQEAYNCHPCPSQVTHFLFKMMSVHTEMMISEKILQTLCNIAYTAAYQRVRQGKQQFKVWVPRVADVTLVLINMGIPFVTLFPYENLQPPFTEGDLLKDVHIITESPSSNKEQSTFCLHNCNNILKYLSYCMGLCPRAYSDTELLLLLTMVGRVSLDTQLILHPSVDNYTLHDQIIRNIRDWDIMLPRICVALTDLSDDHHNMCLLVHLMPDSTRGKQLRQHLSLSMISKLLDGKCTCRPAEKEFQLSDLRPYLSRMQPSTLKGMLSSSNKAQKEEEEDFAILDQQTYYLCYSLLTLTNEASNFQLFPAHQKEQLLFLSSELEMYIKCDIRENEKCLYRSKVKDLVARIYTKWQMLLQRTRPLHGKLYDYWQPLPVNTLSSVKEEEMIFSADGEEQDPIVVEDGEEMEATMGRGEEFEGKRPEVEDEVTQQEKP
ncbi:hypothetical protein LDENG_00128500, partial [Lucifuga dentata]